MRKTSLNHVASNAKRKMHAPKKLCACTALRCGSEETGIRANWAQEEEKITLQQIGATTDDDPALAALRDEIVESTNDKIEFSLLWLKSPRIWIKPTEFGAGNQIMQNIKPIHLSVLEGAILVNNRAWIPWTLISAVTKALHTDFHKCCSRMMRKATQSVYFIGMNEIFDNFVKACIPCIDNRPMKPLLSRVPTERASRPFEIITMDYAEFTEKKVNPGVSCFVISS